MFQNPNKPCSRAGVRHGHELPAGRDLLLHARVLRLLLHVGLLPAQGGGPHPMYETTAESSLIYRYEG